MALALDSTTPLFTGTSNSSGTTLVLTVAGVTAGDYLVLGIAHDITTIGPQVPTISSVVDDQGNTWSLVKSQTGTAADSTGVAAYVCPYVTVVPTTVTIMFSAAITAKVAACYKATGGASYSGSPTPVGTQGSSSSPSAGAITVANVGDLVVGMTGYENQVVPTDDTDTTNGSWIAGSGATIGSGAAAARLHVQSKVVTGSGAQTYNINIGSKIDWAALAFVLVQGAVSAVLAAPLGALTASISATPDHPATVSAPLGALSAAIAAAVEHAATLSAPLGAATVAIAATVEHPATVTAVLGGLTATVAANPTHPASLDVPLGGLTTTIAVSVTPPISAIPDPHPHQVLVLEHTAVFVADSADVLVLEHTAVLVADSADVAVFEHAAVTVQEHR